jgi:hypothetical protein
MQRARILFASLLAALFAASPAMAGEISVEDGVLRITSDGGTVDVEAIQEDSDFFVFDWSYEIKVGEGCTLDNPEIPVVGAPTGNDERTITCKGVTDAVEVQTSGRGNYVYVFSELPKRFTGGEGADTLVGSGPGNVIATGGEGDDYLSGGSGTDSLDGGAGNDELSGRSGSDTLTGGDGNDDLQGDDGGDCCFEEEEEGHAPPEPSPASPDVLDGGNGDDKFRGPDASDRLSGGDGSDTIFIGSRTPGSLKLGDGGFDVENITVYGGDATVTGDPRDNKIFTGGGKDTVDPGAGADKVDTGSGDDSVNARDGAADVISCGDGADRVVADPADEIESSCETLDRGAGLIVNGIPVAPPVAVAPPIVIPSDLKVTSKRKGRRVTLRGRLVLPAGAAPSLCAGGGVTLEIKGVGRNTIRKSTVLDAKCAFAIKLKGKAKKRLRIKSRFAGTPGLAPFASSTR